MRVGFVLCTAFILLWIAPLSEGYSGGINDVSPGCTCHGGGAISQDASLSVEGVPVNWSHGESYTIYVNLTGPNSQGVNAGGFNLRASTGTLSPFDGLTQVLDGEATHTPAGNDERNWIVVWHAPSTGSSVTFTSFGNAVNGDGVAGNGDHWTKETVTAATAEAEVTDEHQTVFSAKEKATILFGVGFAAVFIVTMEQVRFAMEDE